MQYNAGSGYTNSPKLVSFSHPVPGGTDTASAPRPSISLFPGKWQLQTGMNQPRDGLVQPWRGQKLAATAPLISWNDSNIEHPQRNVKVLDEVSEEARMGIMT